MYFFDLFNDLRYKSRIGFNGSKKIRAVGVRYICRDTHKPGKACVSELYLDNY